MGAPFTDDSQALHRYYALCTSRRSAVLVSANCRTCKDHMYLVAEWLFSILSQYWNNLAYSIFHKFFSSYDLLTPVILINFWLIFRKSSFLFNLSLVILFQTWFHYKFQACTPFDSLPFYTHSQNSVIILTNHFSKHLQHINSNFDLILSSLLDLCSGVRNNATNDKKSSHVPATRENTDSKIDRMQDTSNGPLKARCKYRASVLRCERKTGETLEYAILSNSEDLYTVDKIDAVDRRRAVSGRISRQLSRTERNAS